VFERGVAGTTLDAVRAAADASKSQLYHYFADKEALIHAVIDRTVQQVLDAQPELARELAETDEVARQALAAGFDRWEEPLREGLEKMRLHGKLRRSADPVRLATATLAAIQGGLVLAQTRRDPQQLRISLDAAHAHLRSFSP